MTWAGLMSAAELLELRGRVNSLPDSALTAPIRTTRDLLAHIAAIEAKLATSEDARERAEQVATELDDELAERKGREHLLLCSLLDALHEVHERFLSQMFEEGRR